MTMPAASEHDRPADIRDTSGRYHPDGQPHPRVSLPPSPMRRHGAPQRVAQDGRSRTRRTDRTRRERAAGARAIRPRATGRCQSRAAARPASQERPSPRPELRRNRRDAPRNGSRDPAEDRPASVGNETRRSGTHAGEQAGGSADSSTDRHEDTRRVFLAMLRDWRGLGQAQLDAAGIRSVRRFDMLEAFVHLFLTSVALLTRRGLARAYRTREANLPCLRGRILFPPHVRENLVDRSRFYVGYDVFHRGPTRQPTDPPRVAAAHACRASSREPTAGPPVAHPLLRRAAFHEPGRRLDAASRGPFDAALRRGDAVGPVVPVRPRPRHVRRPARQPGAAVSDGGSVRGLRHRRRPPTPAALHGARPGAGAASGGGSRRPGRLSTEAGHRPDRARAGPIHPGCEVEAPRPPAHRTMASVRRTRTSSSPTAGDTAAGGWSLVYPRTTAFPRDDHLPIRR